MAFFGGIYGLNSSACETRIREVLALIGLSDRRGSLTRELPTGLKQRLALGCALLHQPPIIFLDEPTSGVDPGTRRNFWDLIYTLADGGVTVFVTTHYMEEAEYCHRLALMNRARLIALDRPAALRALLTQPILELTTDNGPAAAQALQGAPGVIEAAMFGRAVHVVTEHAASAAQTIPQWLSGRGIQCLGVTQVPPSLEDVFVSLVRREGGVVVE